MAEKRSSIQGLWSSRTAFILAVAGSAVGLGNIWKFPYIAGENGGGAFVLVYLLCVFTIGLPIMMSEVMIGRRGRRNPIRTMQLLGEEESHHSGWKIVGLLAVVAGFLILSFYSVIAGWSLAYIWKSASGIFMGADTATVDRVFVDLTGSWQRLAAWHTVFMLMTVAVAARGVQRGLERAVQILMPALLLLLVILVFYAASQGSFSEAVVFMFRPDLDSLTAASVLTALGHAFFTLSLGMGAVMAYGAYLPEDSSILGTTVAVVVTDTLIAILAGLVIFPIVFANGLDPAFGPGLIFETLPLAFGNMAYGEIFGTLFFVLLTFAAWTSSIGLIEPAIAWLVESYNVHRRTAAFAIGGCIWALGFLSILSFNVLSDFTFMEGTLFENIDHLSSNILLPAGGFLVTLFAGWVMCDNSSSQELGMGTGVLYRGWRFLTRFVVPVAVLLVFLSAAGIIEIGQHA